MAAKCPFFTTPPPQRQGRGIFLTKSLEKVTLAEPQVAQVYISRPLLLDGFKFDIRMYALVTSCSPLRVYKASACMMEGLVEGSLAPYSYLPTVHRRPRPALHLRVRAPVRGQPRGPLHAPHQLRHQPPLEPLRPGGRGTT